MPRRLEDFLTAYETYCKEIESPSIFSRWVGIATIASCLERRVWSDWLGLEGHIFPNLYTILVGPSGEARKSTALAVGKRLLVDVGLPVGANKTSKEALVKRLMSVAKPCSVYEGKDGVMGKHMSLTICASEFGGLIQANVDITRDLTDLWDCPDMWEYDVISRPGQYLENCCLNIFGGTTPQDLSKFLPADSVGTGFTSRVIFVYSEQSKILHAPDVHNPKRLKLREDLVSDLADILTIEGCYRPDESWVKLWIPWYNHVRTKPRFYDHNFLGYNSRRGPMTIKLSMIVAASEGNDLVISRRHLERAIQLLQEVEQQMGRSLQVFGTYRYASVVERLFNVIETEQVITESRLRGMFRRDLGPDEFRKALEQFEKEGSITKEEDPGTEANIIRFQLRPEAHLAGDDYIQRKEATES